MDWIGAEVGHDASFTKLEKRVAAYLTANPDALLVDTSRAIAERVGVSPMTVTRFFKKLGYENAAAARRKLKRQVYGPELSRIGNRFDLFRESKPPAGGDAVLQSGIAAIRRAFEVRSQPQWQRIVEAVAGADSVYVTGFQTMGYLARGFAMRLGYVRPGVHEIDGADGAYAGLLTDPAPRRALLIMDIFRYARNGPVLARAARARGVEVVVFCDEFCDWAADITPHVVALPSATPLFFRSDTGIHFSLSLLEQDVIDAYGEQRVREHMELLSEAQEWFGQYSK
ncbi:MurR/RpiR family transcriptional regulator [Acidihalobacter prosperus]|uniref:HTH rpiR-type domain-containing protein n=1 Tax=Acidihalobacter prosperus TaxID=160660 RepID=A0A1A6C101_9GAMM|nr:MurR/RpiR family transcriptional regulator [Acidihalobacter prosperus]OBS08241.1 hypothetical protein Thpro_022491 [Acidihalobacter prosperus]